MWWCERRPRTEWCLISFGCGFGADCGRECYRCVVGRSLGFRLGDPSIVFFLVSIKSASSLFCLQKIQRSLQEIFRACKVF